LAVVGGGLLVWELGLFFGDSGSEVETSVTVQAGVTPQPGGGSFVLGAQW